MMRPDKRNKELLSEVEIHPRLTPDASFGQKVFLDCGGEEDEEEAGRRHLQTGKF